jgi:hypothetical protein
MSISFVGGGGPEKEIGCHYIDRVVVILYLEIKN